MQNYQHLTPEERAVIMIELRAESSLRSIGKLLNRSASTISRELSRNQNQHSVDYCASAAGQQYKVNRQRSRKRAKLIPGTFLYEQVKEWLVHNQWSPMQISGTLYRHFPDQVNMQVSHETIYASIYAHPKNELKRQMIQALRRSKRKRGPRGTKDSNYSSLKIAEDQFIHHRPEEINERRFPGHWEGDLIVGAMNRSCIGTVVERKTGFVILSKMKSKSAASVRAGFERQMKKLPAFLRLSMTYDRGAEMAQHPIMSKNLKMKIYFADPHAPWQRGSSENINGLLRQYLPKGEDLSQYSQATLNKIAWLLNTRPRERFNFRTPQELIETVLEDHLNSVALES
ncbi:MAG: IS30 family transposase [Xanthomonadales bacterium]|nr:IS30 family transposase [Xanthomonadales bacterium]